MSTEDEEKQLAFDTVLFTVVHGGGWISAAHRQELWAAAVHTWSLSQQPHSPFSFSALSWSAEVWPLDRTTPSGIQDLSTHRSIRFIIRSRSISIAWFMFVPLAALVSK